MDLAKVKRDGVIRIVKKDRATGNLIASGKYVLDELEGSTQSDPVPGDVWKTTFYKCGNHLFVSNFASTKFAPGNNHKEFFIIESADLKVLSFYHIVSGKLDNSWYFCSQNSDGNLKYIDYNHGSLSGISPYCEGTSILRSFSM